MLALLARQAQGGFAFRAIAEHVCIGVLIAVMSAEHAAHLIFKGAPFVVFGLSFIDLAREGARGGPDAQPDRRGVQAERDDGPGQGLAPDQGHGDRDAQKHQCHDRQDAVESVRAVASVHEFIKLFLKFCHFSNLILSYCAHYSTQL